MSQEQQYSSGRAWGLCCSRVLGLWARAGAPCEQAGLLKPISALSALIARGKVIVLQLSAYKLVAIVVE